MQIEEVVVSEAVDQSSLGSPAPRRIGWEYERDRVHGGCRDAVNEDIDRFRLPTLVRIECSTRFLGAVSTTHCAVQRNSAGISYAGMIEQCAWRAPTDTNGMFSADEAFSAEQDLAPLLIPIRNGLPICSPPAYP